MLNKEELIQIGKKECIDMLGLHNVEKYIDLCCLFHSNSMDDEFLTVGIGMDTNERMQDTGIVFGNTKMNYYAIVKIDPNDGTVYRDLENSILPHCFGLTMD